MSGYLVVGWTVLIAFTSCFLSTKIALTYAAIIIFAHILWISVPGNRKERDDPAMESREKQLRDIYHIAFLLRQTRLDNDVVPLIIEHAELWQTATTDAQFLPNRRISEQHAPHQLLVCEVGRSRVVKSVRKVSFRITAHDQGFADDREGGSWTWFTAHKTPANDVAPPSSDAEARATTPDDQHREIVRNPMGNGRWTIHEVTWRADSEDPAEAEWVGSLMAGERFTVHAWARFPGWQNYVRDVAVKVYSVAVA